jgi:hypothetical protein
MEKREKLFLLPMQEMGVKTEIFSLWKKCINAYLPYA